MDAGVLQLHVFPHEPAPHRPKLLAPGEVLSPTLTPDSPSDPSEPVSLIIPTFFNRSLKNGSLQYLLEGLAESKTVRQVVLVVPENSCEQEEQPVAVPAHVELTQVVCPPNRRALARNRGAAAAVHSLLLFLDDDMVPESWKTVDAIVSRLLTDAYDCALFPRRQYARYPLLHDREALERTIREWRSAATQRLEIPESRVFDPVRHGCAFKTMAFCFPGCFMLIRRAAYQLVGGFPEEFEGWGFEDSDFAMRATAVLRVLNLFRQGPPLLHIDHPVSPYKSEEYEQNFRRFQAAHTLSDVDRFCAQVIAGDDFGVGPQRAKNKSEHFAPLVRLVESAEVPVFGQEPTRREVFRHYEQILEHRFEKGFDAVPRHVVLHGSRSTGRGGKSSDYDVLFLFRGGTVREFFTCGSQGTAVDLEFSDYAKFESIAQRPVFHPLFGPLELEKIACARVLHGDADEWAEWSRRQLSQAIANGLAYWLLCAAGIKLRHSKLAPLGIPLLAALRHVLIRLDGDAHRDDLARLEDFQPDGLKPYLRAKLDDAHPGWRDDVQHHRRVFAFQVPEVWSALRWLSEVET